jgi:hypothetical protein
LTIKKGKNCKPAKQTYAFRSNICNTSWELLSGTHRGALQALRFSTSNSFFSHIVSGKNLEKNKLPSKCRTGYRRSEHYRAKSRTERNPGNSSRIMIIIIIFIAIKRLTTLREPFWDRRYTCSRSLQSLRTGSDNKNMILKLLAK